MKKLIILFTILFPFICHAQNTVDADFCISRTTHAPFTAVSGQTYRGFSIDANGPMSCITIPDNTHDIHITKMYLVNSRTGNGAIHVGSNCKNITIDTCFIATSYRGVYLQYSGATDNSMVYLHVNNNRFFNIADAAGHPNGGGSSVQYFNCNGGGIQMNYNKTLTTIVSAEVGDIYNFYKTNGVNYSYAEAIGNQVQGGSTLTAGKSGVILGDVGGSYQIATDNIFVNSGAQGAQVQGGHDIIMRRNKAYGVATSYTLAGFVYGNYSGASSYNVTIDSNRAKWFNKSTSRLDKWFDPNTVSVPIGWNTNVSDNTLSTSLLPTPLFSTCSVIVAAPNISYSPSTNVYVTGIAVSKSPTNSGGGSTSWNINKSLPAGLSFNTSNGVISGTPTTQTASDTYTITATNSGGSSSTTIGITVNTPLSTPSFSYSPSSNVFITGTSVSKSPISTGGAISSYSINTSLPSGLSFNTSTGVISGTPTVTSANTAYTITGTNASGSSTFTINIQVNAPVVIPPTLTYATLTNTFTYGEAITVLYPATTGTITSWSISGLPAGLSFSNGVISGTPTNIGSTTVYNVTATNSGGSSVAHVSITVIPANLIIKADSKQKKPGAVNPTLTVSYDGFKFSDNASTLTTQPTISTTAVTGSPMGSYPIQASGAVSSKYTITYVDGTLLVGNGFYLNGRFGGIIRLY